ncbi:hypothetical protein [Salimicrobium halophilum]|uniref:Uncharacterized protein n=1 Tax=Salimicrobium halophilum TaxID=86666 RepID=A0A1G8QI88_9BACI|nr:hypothetical protein [Salimicrobium halophilum]SDJ04336.1 hypothetical protein SAMN04490247_0633 [Salimicrobium halophilum]
MRKAIDILNERNGEHRLVEEAIDKELTILFRALQEKDEPQIAWSKMRLATLREQKLSEEIV